MFRNFRLKTQFYSVLAITVLILLLAGGGILGAISPIDKEWKAYQSEVAHRQTLLMQIKAGFGYGGAIHNFKNYVLRGAEKYLPRLEKNFSQLDALFEQYATMPNLSAEEQQALAKIKTVAHKYRDQLQVVKRMLRQGKSPQQIDAVVKINDAPALEGFLILDEAYKQLTQEANLSLTGRIDSAVGAGVWGVLVVILFIVLGLLFLSRSIIKGITGVKEAMVRAEKDNDISTLLPSAGNDEISELATSFNNLMGRFVSMVTDVARSASAVGVVTVEQSDRVEHTVCGVRKQRVEIEQVATAMNQMSATVQEVSANINRAAKAAANADVEAGKGSQIMTETIGSIKSLYSRVDSSAQVISHLDHESLEISKVLEVINSISEQTNLLALNAAIEAARAGEHGRGFAVVADEVRALAAKTKGSTNEISVMIDSLQGKAREAVAVMKKSQEDAQTSSTQVEMAGAALNQIVSDISTITEMTTQIATAAQEQSHVTEEISASITNISQAANSTAQIADKTLDATSAIGLRVNELTTHASQFNIIDSSMQLEQAKAAHLSWRLRLRAYLDGKGGLSKDQAVSHKCCALGKWYYATGLNELSHIPEMVELEQPHAELHGLIGRIIDLTEAGRITAAEEEYQKVDALSTQIVALLEQIQEKL